MIYLGVQGTLAERLLQAVEQTALVDGSLRIWVYGVMMWTPRPDGIGVPRCNDQLGSSREGRSVRNGDYHDWN